MSCATLFDMLTLTSGDARLALVPEAGGAIAAWRVGGQPLFHESGVAPGPDWDPLAMASFPLVPFSNRIGGGRFRWDGAEYHLPPSVLRDRHSIHGVGWRRTWQVVEAAPDRAVLRLDHDGDGDWPWPFVAEQRFHLTAGGLDVRMTATSGADIAVPLAFGMHPYFDAAGAQLDFAAAHIWRAAHDGLPLHAQTPGPAEDFGGGLAVAATDLDNGYDGWTGLARIAWEGRRVELLISSDLPCAVVYTPPGAGYFCFEPVPHSNNVLNLGGRGQAMPVAAPGETIAARVRFETRLRDGA
jgi:aldose 1-epimerase